MSNASLDLLRSVPGYLCALDNLLNFNCLLAVGGCRIVGRRAGVRLGQVMTSKYIRKLRKLESALKQIRK